jgi:regulator of PEP synthase PpsR (kinase-PPPase family)
MELSQDFWIFVLSDGSGQTGKRVLEAALLQFDQAAMVIRIPHIATVAEVKEVVAEAARTPSPAYGGDRMRSDRH